MVYHNVILLILFIQLMFFFFVGCQKLSKIFRGLVGATVFVSASLGPAGKMPFLELNGSQNPGTLGTLKIAG